MIIFNSTDKPEWKNNSKETKTKQIYWFKFEKKIKTSYFKQHGKLDKNKTEANILDSSNLYIFFLGWRSFNGKHVEDFLQLAQKNLTVSLLII